MPRYFFHLRCWDGTERDLEGAELVDLRAVKNEGVASAKELVACALKAGTPLHDALAKTFEVEDDRGAIVMRIPFEEAAHADDRRPRSRVGPTHNSPRPAAGRSV